MVTKKDIEEEMLKILPANTDSELRKKIVSEKAEKDYNSKSAKQLARIRYNLRCQNEVKEAKKAVAKYKIEKEKAIEEAIETIEAEDESMPAATAIEIGNEVAKMHGQPTIDMASQTAQSIMALQGTTKPEIVRLLTQLNVNLNLQLTKTDTANLLACLLTANENQLKALQKNKKVPVAIRTIIKRILDDSKLGNIDTVEKLWDRIFGKTGMMLNLPEQTQQATGIIPNTPISREAYIIIRDTLIK